MPEQSKANATSQTEETLEKGRPDWIPLEYVIVIAGLSVALVMLFTFLKWNDKRRAARKLDGRLRQVKDARKWYSLSRGEGKPPRYSNSPSPPAYRGRPGDEEQAQARSLYTDIVVPGSAWVL